MSNEREELINVVDNTRNHVLDRINACAALVSHVDIHEYQTLLIKIDHLSNGSGRRPVGTFNLSAEFARRSRIEWWNEHNPTRWDNE